VADRVHAAGARLYLTMNTLVFERELGWVEAVLRRVAAAGVDALIVQDPAVCAAGAGGGADAGAARLARR
jgi:collagenase-like PrtC family protease